MDKEVLTSKILTLTTDWNQHDYYNGVLRGKIASICPELAIIEITNQVPSFNLNNAAFVLRYSYQHFPKGTIHLMMLNNENSQSQRMLAFTHNDHHFVVADNGIIGLIFKDPPQKVYAFPFEAEGGFSSLDAVITAIESIYLGKDLSKVASLVTNYDLRIPLRATNENNAITGSIIYIDSYLNAISNISMELFEKVGQGRKFEIFVQSQHNKVEKIARNYNDVEPGDLLALFNSAGLLEIAINNGYAAQLLNLSNGSSIRIKFFEE